MIIDLEQYKEKLTGRIVNTGWISVENTLALIAEIERLQERVKYLEPFDPYKISKD